jgi:DNA repair photolyase
MSLPTLDNNLAKIYEPKAPSPSKRLETLQAARDAGLNVFAAIAPTYPECDEDDLRKTLEAVAALRPFTIFHEPINVRAENVQRIATHAAELGVSLRTEVFANGASRRRYAVEQLMAMQRVATDLRMEEHLHLWPDKALRSKGAFLETRETVFATNNPGLVETGHEKEQRRAANEAAYEGFAQWLSHWHERISEWPGKKS